ncbi:MAG: hypothetical protein M0T79_03410 [Actinomycetota bacterium]|nr:hypothetical protein [Actinomycetota bacterium]
MRSLRRLAAVTAIALGLVVGGSALAGCTAARNVLGTTDSLCFHTLPEARSALGSRALFAGVRLLPIADVVRSIERLRSHPDLPASLVRLEHKRACLVAFRGEFTLARTRLGWAPRPGPYKGAVVVVIPSDNKVIATILFRRVPGSIEFDHRIAFVT